jgi:hypothetical protein
MGLQAATELALVVENFPEARLESFVAATAVEVNKSGLNAYSTALTWDIEMRPITDTPFPPYITFLNIRYWAISMVIGVRREHDLKVFNLFGIGGILCMMRFEEMRGHDISFWRVHITTQSISGP